MDPAQHHFGDLGGFGVGDAQAAHELRFHAQFLQHRADLRPAAMDDDDIDADRFHQHHVLGKVARGFGVSHRVAAIFDDESPARITLHIGQRFDEDFGLGEQGGIGGVVAGHARAHTAITPGPQARRRPLSYR